VKKTKKGLGILPKLKKGYLSNFGYAIKESNSKRQLAILKAVRKEGSLPVLKRLVVLRTYGKNEPKRFRIFDKDVKYVQKLREKEK